MFELVEVLEKDDYAYSEDLFRYFEGTNTLTG